MTWLTSVTLNEARGRLRKRRTTVGVDAIETAQQTGAEIIMLNAPMENPKSSAARSQMRLLIERAVDELPEPFRMVFILREVE